MSAGNSPAEFIRSAVSPAGSHQLVDFAPHDAGQVCADLFDRPVPPLQFQQPCGRSVVETRPYRFGRDAAHDRVGRNVPCDDGPRRDHGAVADPDARHDDRFVTDPYVVADDDVALVVPRRGDVRPVEFPLLEEERKGVIGQRAERVVRAVEQEPRAAGDGAEFADDQPVLVDRVVVQTNSTF